MPTITDTDARADRGGQCPPYWLMRGLIVVGSAHPTGLFWA
jgi:hypothetical protein